MAKVGRRRLARTVVRLLGEQSGRKTEVIQQLAAYLIVHRQAKHLDLLMQDIADEMFVQHKHLSAEVSHAHELTQEVRTALTDLLTSATGAKTVELASHLEPGLIGGVVVRTPRQELDTSVRRQLKTIAGGMTI